MAIESRFWRKKIDQDIRFISKKINKNINWIWKISLDKFFSEIEIRFFTLTYSFRKLMEMGKFPDSVSDFKIRVRVFKKKKGKRIDPWSFCWDCYNLNNYIVEEISLRNLCNQFIHSHFFEVASDGGVKLNKIFFVSDRDKDKFVYAIDIKKFLKQLKFNLNKYPQNMKYKYDPVNKGWEREIG